MLSQEQNQALTAVGPGTPMGTVFRRYWLPVLLAAEVAERDGPPVHVRLLGEDLLAFRDSDGRVALVDAFCPHRRAPLFFGRNEECGLRCVYHGWKFDADGACVDMPSEPPDSLFKTKVSLTAYPTWEGADMVWAYLGPPSELPPPPAYELTRVPATHRSVSKTRESCNYLQAFEGGIDTAHISFLHNMKLGDRANPRALDTSPRLEVEKTAYGFRYHGIRNAGDNEYIRVYQYLMPAQQCRGLIIGYSGEQVPVPTMNGHIWVPIDDTHTFVYNYIYSSDPDISLPSDFVLEHEIKSGRGPDDLMPDFSLKKNAGNDYMIDRKVQRTRTYTGITGINTQDYALQEGMGPIVDRTREHLGTTDRAIIAARQLLLEAIDDVSAGRRPRGADTGACSDVRATDLLVPKGDPWRESLPTLTRARF
jgi:phthalate 4,5-dioxygenase oxygenase subunit